VLQDITQVLKSPHHAQELLSGSKTPTLSHVFQAYEDIINYWKTLRTTIPELKHYINISISKLEEYLTLSWKTHAYAHAMGMIYLFLPRMYHND
ncbi:hypothetical protein P691DRAFT_689728, partial [Macrolepiota fuliginosa MF-IS2]